MQHPHQEKLRDIRRAALWIAGSIRAKQRKRREPETDFTKLYRELYAEFPF
jgi:hypothetical protein